MIICPKCHHSNPDNAKFCIECGRELLSNRCPKCNIKVEEDAKFCVECGMNLDVDQPKMYEYSKPPINQSLEVDTPIDNRLFYGLFIVIGTIIIIIGFFSSWFSVTENLYGTSEGTNAWEMVEDDSIFVYLYIILIGSVSILLFSLIVLLTKHDQYVKKQIKFINLIGTITLIIIIISILGMMHGHVRFSEEIDKYNENYSNLFGPEVMKLDFEIGGIITIIGGIVCYICAIKLKSLISKKY